MIFADKLIELRKKAGWSQEELADKMGVSRQSISKWESAQSMPDMGRVVRLAQLFGVSTDYLLREDVAQSEEIAVVETDAEVRTVSMEEANAFLRLRDITSRRIAIGVMLCILSPVLLILLAGAQQYGRLGLTQEQAAGLGLVVLMLMVGGAVAIFIQSGIRLNRFEYLEKEPIETLYGVDGMVRERRERFQPTYSSQLTVGVVLCVVSVIPLFLVGMILKPQDEFAQVVSVAVLLTLVAIGVLLLVRVSSVWTGFQMLLEEGDYTREEKSDRKEHGYIAGVYWLLVTAGYLAWSFISKDWQRTWIVWPVAGVAFGAVYAQARAIRRKG